MKRNHLFQFTVFLSVTLCATLVGSSSSMPGSSSTPGGSNSSMGGSSSINTGSSSGSKGSPVGGMEKLEKPMPRVSTTPPAKLPPLTNAPPLVEKNAEYFHPGILVLRKGVWEGSDHLYNLTNNIGVYVSIIKPEELTLDFNSDSIKKLIEEIFAKVDINPVSKVAASQPALPSFEVEILIYPIERGFVASISGNLFESVTLERVKLDEDMTFQAITWAKQTLIVGPKNKFNDQLINAVTDIATSFADRFETYEKLRRQE